MKKEKFIASTIILIIGGLITKFLGMLIKIIMTRIVGVEGISLYVLVFPTFALFMTLSQLGFPIAISKLVAEEKYNNKNLIFSIFPFSILLNLILMFLIFILAPYISVYLLKDARCYYPILAIAFVLPFDSTSAILRGYFFGKQRMIPHVVSNATEQVVRLFLILFFIPRLLEQGIVYAVVGLILVNVVSELFSSLVLFFFMPKHIKITSDDKKVNKNNILNVLNIALPTTGGRIIGSIGYFLEPILITSSMLLSGYSKEFITLQYGIIEGFVIPLLMLPSFFSNAISSALIPVVSKANSDNNKIYIRRKLKQAITISLSIGVVTTLILMISPDYFLNLIYNQYSGGTYLRFIAPFFLFHYIQSPLASILQSMDKAKEMMLDNLKGTILRSILIFVLGTLSVGIYGFLIAMVVNIIFVTFMHWKHIKKELY